MSNLWWAVFSEKLKRLGSTTLFTFRNNKTFPFRVVSTLADFDFEYLHTITCQRCGMLSNFPFEKCILMRVKESGFSVCFVICVIKYRSLRLSEVVFVPARCRSQRKAHTAYYRFVVENWSRNKGETTPKNRARLHFPLFHILLFYFDIHQ